MIKAIAIDLDGTLLNNNKQIPLNTLEIMKKLDNEGFIMIIATGRPLRTVKEIVPDWFSKFYWITSNGAWILKDGTILKKFEMTYEETISVVDIITYNGLHAHVEAHNKFFSDTELKTEIINFQYSPLCEFVGDACMVLAYVEKSNSIQVIKNQLPPSVSMTLTNNNSMINIGYNGCGKANSVDWVLKNEKLNFENLIAFGDDVNDIELVKQAKIGVAVENAHIELKKVAGVITKSNDEEGVGFTLSNLLFNGY